MKPSSRAVYTEHTPWPGWIWIMLWGTLALSAFLVATTPGPVEERTLALIAIVGVTLLVQFGLGGITVRLHPDALRVGMGRSALLGTTIAYRRIVTVEARRYSPLADFGGWGWRKKGNRTGWTARGSEAVVLTLDDGREVYIGTDRPDRLRERILTLGGARIGGGTEAGG